jgi:hypothetical protein
MFITLCTHRFVGSPLEAETTKRTQERTCLGVYLGLQGGSTCSPVFLGLQGFETAENALVDARCAFGNVYVGEGALKQLSSLSPHSFASIGFLQ